MKSQGENVRLRPGRVGFWATLNGVRSTNSPSRGRFHSAPVHRSAWVTVPKTSSNTSQADYREGRPQLGQAQIRCTRLRGRGGRSCANSEPVTNLFLDINPPSRKSMNQGDQPRVTSTHAANPMSRREATIGFSLGIYSEERNPHPTIVAKRRQELRSSTVVPDYSSAMPEGSRRRVKRAQVNSDLQSPSHTN